MLTNVLGVILRKLAKAKVINGQQFSNFIRFSISTGFSLNHPGDPSQSTFVPDVPLPLRSGEAVEVELKVLPWH